MKDWVGHDAQVERLFIQLARGTLHHALLFEGPSGLGKRKIAHRLAMLANCGAFVQDGELRWPCGQCSSCRLILQGGHPDVVLVSPDPEKATPTIAVDQIREVIRQSTYHRYSGRRRMIIIDPAEAMPAPSANALLKTLEEAPDGTGFVLIATHASALLPTIRSRVQRIRFGPVQDELLKPWLLENGATDPDSLLVRAAGRPGIALELLSQSEDISVQRLRILVAALGGALTDVFSMSETVCKGAGRAEWMPAVEGLLEVIEDLMRDVVIVSAGDRHPLRWEAQRELVERWASVLWPAGVSRVEQALLDARADLAANVAGRTVVDALVTRLRTELGPARKAKFKE